MNENYLLTNAANQVPTIADALKVLAYGPETRGGKPEHGIPRTLGDIAETLRKIEQHLSVIAEKAGKDG